MQLSQSAVVLDTCAKFFRSIHLSGCVKHDVAILRNVELLECEHIAQSCNVEKTDVCGINQLFSVDVLLKAAVFPFKAFIVFSFSDLSQQMIALYDLVHEQLAASSSFAVYRRFLEAAATPEYRRVLDIGGRSRSQIDRRSSFPNSDVVVLDILPGDNVDVVGDAHDLSGLAGGSFDAIQSASVFEHLLMPWKVVLEMNRVLRPGGLIYIHTHQSLGAHDVPCDFWRFSADAWPALFNPKTGFEIVESAMSHESFLIPHFWRLDQQGAESAVGFEVSVVLVRKVANTSLSWNVSPHEVSGASYPTAVLSDPGTW